MSGHSNPLRAAACALASLVLAGLATTAGAQSKGTPTNLPIISGSAEAPRTVTSGTQFSYTFWARDKDRIYSPTGFTEVADRLGLRSSTVMSMKPGWTTNGGPELDAMGKPTGYAKWTITGTAKTVTEEAIFSDGFFVRDSGSGDLYDGGIKISQFVIIKP